MKAAAELRFRCVWKKCGEKFSDVEKVFLSSRQLAPSAKLKCPGPSPSGGRFSGLCVQFYTASYRKVRR